MVEGMHDFVIIWYQDYKPSAAKDTIRVCKDSENFLCDSQVEQIS